MTSRQRNWLLILAVLVMIVLAQGLSPPADISTSYFDTPRPMVIAHQGGDGVRPGNTMLAFQHAADLGVDVLEMDVHRSADGVLVLMHDATVDRTTDGSGALAGMTLAQIKALDAAYHWPYQGDVHPYRGRGVRVPTLAEVVERFPALRYNVEIKPDDASMGAALCDELERLGAARRVLVASFHAASLSAFRRACPTVPTSAHRSEVNWFYLRYRLGLGWVTSPDAAALQLPQRYEDYDFTDPDFIAAATRSLHVDFWTVNDAEAMRLLAQRGADGIITDRPDVLLQVLDRR